MLTEGSGVVLTLQVRRSTMVYENRKPWNRGTLILPSRGSRWTHRSSTSRRAGARSCEKYADFKGGLLVATGQTSTQWPPELLPNLLDLQTIEPVPAEYGVLVSN